MVKRFNPVDFYDKKKNMPAALSGATTNLDRVKLDVSPTTALGGVARVAGTFAEQIRAANEKKVAKERSKMRSALLRAYMAPKKVFDPTAGEASIMDDDAPEEMPEVSQYDDAEAAFNEANPSGMEAALRVQSQYVPPESGMFGPRDGAYAGMGNEMIERLGIRDYGIRQEKEAAALAAEVKAQDRIDKNEDYEYQARIQQKYKDPKTQKPDYITYVDKDENKHVRDMSNPEEAEEAISNIESGEWTKPDTTRGKHLSTTSLNEYVDEKGTFIGSWYWDKNNRRMSKMGDSEAVFPLGSQKRSTGQTGAALMSAANFNNLEDELHEESSGLRALNRYAVDVRKGGSGINLLVDKLIGEFKTIFGGTLTPSQYHTLKEKGELQGLLGKFRKDVVGGGVMTEYDAGRVLARLGGDVNALRNPKIAKDLLKSLFSEKLRSYNHKQKRHAFQQTLAHERPNEYTTTFEAYPQEDVDKIMTSVFDPVVEDSTGSGGTTPKYSPEQLQEEKERRAIEKRKRELLLNPGKANKS